MANNNIKPLLLSNTSSESNISENMKNNEISIVVSEDKVRSIKVHFWHENSKSIFFCRMKNLRLQCGEN